MPYSARPRLRPAAVLVGLALALTACGSSVHFGEDEVDDPSGAVATLDGKFREDAIRDKATTVEDSRCYLARTKDGDTLDTSAYCGPARHPGSQGDAVWDTYR